jgi:hypothetical protein
MKADYAMNAGILQSYIAVAPMPEPYRTLKLFVKSTALKFVLSFSSLYIWTRDFSAVSCKFTILLSSCQSWAQRRLVHCAARWRLTGGEPDLGVKFRSHTSLSKMRQEQKPKQLHCARFAHFGLNDKVFGGDFRFILMPTKEPHDHEHWKI